jgi:hypothetical protein
MGYGKSAPVVEQMMSPSEPEHWQRACSAFPSSSRLGLAACAGAASSLGAATSLSSVAAFVLSSPSAALHAATAQVMINAADCSNLLIINMFIFTGSSRIE